MSEIIRALARSKLFDGVLLLLCGLLMLVRFLFFKPRRWSIWFYIVFLVALLTIWRGANKIAIQVYVGGL